MGDVLQTIPLLFGLRERYPAATLHVLTGEQYECLLSDLPCVDRIISLPMNRLHRAAKPPSDFRSLGRVLLDPIIEFLIEEQYSLVLNCQFSRFEMCLAGSLDPETVLGAYYSPACPKPRWLEDLWISIHVLSPLRPIRPEAVTPGRHGLVLRAGGRMGLLLPDVAREQGWGVEELLAGLSVKAGLAPDAWRGAGSRLMGFETESWGEEDR